MSRWPSITLDTRLTTIISGQNIAKIRTATRQPSVVDIATRAASVTNHAGHGSQTREKTTRTKTRPRRRAKKVVPRRDDPGVVQAADRDCRVTRRSRPESTGCIDRDRSDESSVPDGIRIGKSFLKNLSQSQDCCSDDNKVDDTMGAETNTT